MEPSKFTFFFILLFLINSYGEARELIFVYEHARHGARGPSSSYDSIFENGYDEYKINWGTDGELSPIGKKQHYYLGLRNKIKYNDFMNFSEYDPRKILIHATDYNRTHQSILSELYGMYEDLLEPELNEKEKDYAMVNDIYMKDSNYELYTKLKAVLETTGNRVNNKSFPVFNVRKFPDKRIFLVDDCLKLNNYRHEKVGKKVREFYDEFDQKFGDVMTRFTGKSLEFFHLYDKMKSVTDHFICDYDNKKDLTPIEREGLNLEEFYNYSKRFYGHFIFDYFVDEYTSGLEETHLMQDMLGYMDRRIKFHPTITYKAPKMVMDCGHDTTVGPIARFMSTAFNIKYHKFCEFACNVYFELYKENDGSYTIDYYLDDELLIKGMNYNEFSSTMKKHFWNDTYIDEFCGKKEDADVTPKNKLEEYSNALFFISIISTILFLIFSTSTIVIFRRLKKLQKKFEANPLLDKEMEGSELPVLT